MEGRGENERVCVSWYENVEMGMFAADFEVAVEISAGSRV
jgi:hypothetical protein